MKKLSVGVIGLGHWGPNIVRALVRNPHVVSVVAADRSEERRKLVSQAIPQVKLTANSNEIFSDPSISAVVIATPTETHYQLGMQAASAGKHILIEKPLTHDTASCKELIQTAEKCGVKLMVGQIFMFNEGVLSLKQA